LAAEIVRLQVILRTKRVNDPHLIAGTARGHIETLLEQFLVAKGKRSALRRVNQGYKDHVAFITLELSGISAEEAVEFVAIW
jgi:hypothetical protein